MRWILIDSRIGQSEDCPHPRPVTYNKLESAGVRPFINLSFYFTGTNPWQIFSFNVTNQSLYKLP